ncbi:MAG: 5-methyltetrahydropteroyltriglutamate--homocysteine S-methyltransferase [Buchnera aphidicola (Eriosoma harunire)]
MTILNHILGFPRIGCHRELKHAQEKYWQKNISQQELLSVGYNIRHKNWKIQIDNNLDFLSVGDFSWYDHVLHTSMLLGNIPERHKNYDNLSKLDILFNIARGSIFKEKIIHASDMTKWFNTNYHYIVPEFNKDQSFNITWTQLFEEIDESMCFNRNIKPVIIGPITYLWLGKSIDDSFNRLDLLNNILPVYKKILHTLAKKNIKWIQIDEPILVLELSDTWKKAFFTAYNYLYGINNLLLTTYFGNIEHNLDIIQKLPIQGLHIDIISEKCNLTQINQLLSKNLVLSLGVINGRNIWKANLVKLFKLIQPVMNCRNNLWIGSSCSLLHTPIDINIENKLDTVTKSWFSFAIQKCTELKLLTNALNNDNINDITTWSSSILKRKDSLLVHNKDVQKRIDNIVQRDICRNNSYTIRYQIQQDTLKLPILPTTTIGSFPQTIKIRKLRSDFKQQKINLSDYNEQISEYIKDTIYQQENLNIDVLVHGEPERNDMVEYFGEQLEGFVFTSYGWVQSYGSRCVKPPIIVGDIYRLSPMTIKWTKYAQSLTNKFVKGMLTGPVTMLLWSFSREDISKEIIAKQLAFALRDEVADLENSGIKIIQIDEPALREGLPLRQSLWKKYLDWAITAFKLASSGVKDCTQIHTHMCYCEFNDIMSSILLLDADVITIETARSNMELLKSFKKFKYLNSIGPGIYDIHSPNIPPSEWIENSLKKALKYIPSNRLWVNPDCGLKTRDWLETKRSLYNMMIAVNNLRSQIS